MQNIDLEIAAAGLVGAAGAVYAKRHMGDGDIKRLARRLQKPESGALIQPNDLHIPGPSQAAPAIAVLGPSGSGKTHLLASLVATWPGPVLFTTTKTDLALLGAWSKALLHQWIDSPSPPASVWDPGGLLGGHWCRVNWDPSVVPAGADPSLHAAQQARVMADELRSGNANAFWALRSEVVLTSLLALGSIRGNLLDLVTQLVHSGPKELVTVLAQGADELRNAGDTNSASALAAIKDGLLTESTSRRAFDELATGLAALQPLLRVRTTADADAYLPSLDLGAWARGQGLAGIVVPPEMGQSLGPLVAALIQDAVAELRRTQGQRKWAALVVLDEAPNIANLPSVPTWATELRGWDAYLVVAAQSSEQFRKWNPHNPVGFVTGHFPLMLVAQGAAEHDLARLISERHGTKIVTHHKGWQNEHEWHERVPVLRPEHVFGVHMMPGHWAGVSHGRLVGSWTLEPADVLLQRLDAAVQRVERRAALREERAGMRGSKRLVLRKGAAP